MWISIERIHFNSQEISAVMVVYVLHLGKRKGCGGWKRRESRWVMWPVGQVSQCRRQWILGNCLGTSSDLSCGLSTSMQMVSSWQMFCFNSVASFSNCSGPVVLSSPSEICAVCGPVLPAQDTGRTLSQMGYAVEECEGSAVRQWGVVGAWPEVLVCGMKVTTMCLGQVPGEGGGVGKRGNGGFWELELCAALVVGGMGLRSDFREGVRRIGKDAGWCVDARVQIKEWGRWSWSSFDCEVGRNCVGIFSVKCLLLHINT